MRARAGLVLCARVAPQQRQSSRQAPSVAPPTRRAASSVSAPMGRTSAGRAASAHALPSLPSSLMHARTAVVLPRARMARSALLAQLATASPANCTFFLFMTHGRLVAPKISTAGWQTAPVHGRLELLARPAGDPSTGVRRTYCTTGAGPMVNFRAPQRSESARTVSHA